MATSLLTAAVLLQACSSGGATQASDELVLEAPSPLRQEGGLLLEEQRWSWQGLSGVAWRASVPLPGKASVSSTGAVVGFQDLLPTDDGPWAAINGGFYDKGGKALGLVIAGGTERSAFLKGGGSGIFFVDPTGPRVIHRDAWSPGP